MMQVGKLREKNKQVQEKNLKLEQRDKSMAKLLPSKKKSAPELVALHVGTILLFTAVSPSGKIAVIRLHELVCFI